jgi:hypothetical protein
MSLPTKEDLWGHIMRHHGDSNILEVAELEKSLKAAKFSVERQWVVWQFREYEKQKLGSFLAGRRGHESRIRWNSAPKRMSSTPATKSNELPRPSTVLEHSIPLRSGIVAKLSLPQDLSRAESERLMEFIKLLPLEA